MNILIAHARTWGVFDEFSARIALHKAHLAHSLAKSSEAFAHYNVASTLSETGSFVDVTATLGRAELLIGLSAHSPTSTTRRSVEINARSPLPINMSNEELSALGSRAARLTRGMGGTLEAAGKVIQATISMEILKAKWDFITPSLSFTHPPLRQYLKDGLSKASRSQDNYLRALIMALVSSHYFHTAYDQAEQVLSTCEQLAAGLGAPSDRIHSSEVLTSGNIQLGVWVSERTLGS